MRRVTTRGGGASRELDDLVHALLISELVKPSPELWLVSPWVSDIPVVDNRSGEIVSLVPGTPARHLRLTEVLIELSRHGCHVHVLVRDDARNGPVVQRLRAACAEDIDIDVQVVDNLHDKGLLTSRYHVQGSMNFTHFGRAVNEEALTVTSDPHDISRAQLDYRERFGPNAS